jgi:peptidoglycan/LPS O-acetylase OafA/YrhL
VRTIIPLLIVTIAVVIVLTLGSSTSLEAQNITNVSNLTGIENTTTSASVTARQNVSPPELEPEDYPTPSPTDK